MKKRQILLLILLFSVFSICSVNAENGEGSEAPEGWYDETTSMLNDIYNMLEQILYKLNSTTNSTSENLSNILLRIQGTGEGANANSTWSIYDMLIPDESSVDNASIDGKLNFIIQKIGNESYMGWTLAQMQTYILRGLIDENEYYILHNGTLANPQGTSVMKAVLANQIILGEQDAQLGDLARNLTQQVVDVSDENKIALQESQASVGQQIMDNTGNLYTMVALSVGAIIFLLAWETVIKEKIKKRHETATNSAGTPNCYGDENIFGSAQCQNCSLRDSCESQILSARSLPKCFGNYLETDDQCQICKQAVACEAATPKEQKVVAQVPNSTPSPSNPPVSSNPLEGF